MNQSRDWVPWLYYPNYWFYPTETTENVKYYENLLILRKIFFKNTPNTIKKSMGNIIEISEHLTTVIQNKEYVNKGNICFQILLWSICVQNE